MSDILHFELEENGKVLCEYVWLGSSGSDLRSKTRVLDSRPASVEDIPCIVVDGSSYGLAPDNEVFLKPRKLFKDPFRQGDHLLVLCDSFLANVDPNAGLLAKPTLQPSVSNTRMSCEEIMLRGADSAPLFSVEQEYSLLPNQATHQAPHHMPPSCGNATSGSAATGGVWPHSHLPDPMCPFLTVPSMEQELARDNKRRISANNGRHLAERHLKTCIHAGIKVTETSQRNAVTWSYKLGPLGGLDLSDELWMSRFLMLRVSEEEGISVSFDPSAAMGGGCRGRAVVKYSTADTRRLPSGIEAIQRYLDLLERAHLQHVLAYSKHSPLRDFKSNFNICVGGSSASASIVVPSKTVLQQAGHLIDRRPPSNMDPYLVTALILATTLELPLNTVPQPPRSVKEVRSSQLLQRGGLRAAFSVLEHVCTSNESAGGVSVGSLSWESECLSAGDSGMNSEDVLIDELDKALLGPDTPPMHADSPLGGSLVSGRMQQQRKRRGYYAEGFDESSSSGTSPMFLS